MRIKKRTDPATQKEKARAGLAENLELARRLEAEPVDEATAFARLDQHLDEVRGRPRAAAQLTPLLSRDPGDLARFRPLKGLEDPYEMLCVVAPDIVRTFLRENLAATEFGSKAESERTSELARLTEERDQLEREEEAAISELEEAGTYVPRRPDARPEIVLEVA